MDVKFNQTNVTMDATINLTGIDENVYRDIVSFISLRLEQEKTNHKEIIVEEKEERSEANQEISKPIEEKKEKVPNSTKRARNNKKILEPFIKDLIGYKADPSKYDILEITCREYLNMHPEYVGPNANSVAFLLKEFGIKSSGKKVVKTKNGNPEHVAFYRIPVPKKSTNDVGKRIHDARKQAGLHRFELAEMIGFDTNIVEKWESGEYIPSPETIQNISKVLGIAV